MVEKLKKRLSHFIDAKFNSLKIGQQITYDHQQLAQLFKDDSFIPLTRWSLSPNIILHVLNDICINNRQNIIEFGAGASTFYIAKLLKVLQFKAKFYSVESDKKWATELQRQLAIYELENYVKVIYAPVTKVPSLLSFKEQSTWYDVGILNEVIDVDIKFDLIVIDGPIGNESPFARYSALPFLKNKIAQEFSIYLDDFNRDQEKIIVKEWQKTFSFHLRDYKRYALLHKSTPFDFRPFQLEGVSYIQRESNIKF